MKKLKLPSTYFNYISLLGTIIAFIATITLIFLTILMTVSEVGSVYTQLFTFIIVPGFLFTGLILISFGMYRKGKQIKEGIIQVDDRKFILDLKNEKTRNAVLIFITITTIFLFSTIIGSYKAFQYSESVEFCGTLCHKVMDPEYVAYQNSPHAKVKCAECHIGEGVDWFVKAKISGLRQVFKYMLDSYDRPIATPIENLRPARETCEKCHWPQKFYGNTLHEKRYFLADSNNTEWDILLNMKIGTGNEAKGYSQGIHWHINPDIQIEYTANKKHDTIYTVKVTNKKTGKISIYKDKELEASIKNKAHIETRIMDCMDCHNRPAHEYRSPSTYVNKFLSSSSEISSIPWLKAASMDALKVNYTTRDSANTGIRKNIINYYQTNYPETYKQYAKAINKAITGILKEYSINAFPEMGAIYRVYPRHIGHLETDGCFRCHNDKHKDSQGKVISKDCSICHTIVGQGIKGSVAYSTLDKPQEFTHPVDIGDTWKESNCGECHKELY